MPGPLDFQNTVQCKIAYILSKNPLILQNLKTFRRLLIISFLIFSEKSPKRRKKQKIFARLWRAKTFLSLASPWKKSCLYVLDYYVVNHEIDNAMKMSS